MVRLDSSRKLKLWISQHLRGVGQGPLPILLHLVDENLVDRGEP